MAVMDYRTRDGLADYGFSIDFQPDAGWRVHIIFQPFNHDQDDSLHLPYQSIDDNGRRYVDWPGKLDSLGDAKTVAGLWAELVHSYRCTQEQKALYVELIDRYLRTQAQGKAIPAYQDRLDDAVDGDSPGSVQPSTYQNRDRVVKRSPTELRERRIWICEAHLEQTSELACAIAGSSLVCPGLP
jgi:hypothetical protein